MNILLISVNQQKSLYPVTPIGMASVAAFLKKNGYQVFCHDVCFETDVTDSIRKAIDVSQPDCIGISIRNIDSTAYLLPEFFLDAAKLAVECCKSACTARLVLGGSGFSVMPVEILKYCGADLGIAGEGESAFLEYLRAIETGREFTDIPGLVMLKDGGFIRNKPANNQDLKEFPYPDRKLYDPEYLKYEKKTPFGTYYGVESIQTKRGCPFQCIYCTYPLIEGTTARLKTPEHLVDELCQIIEKQGTNRVEIVDSIFNVPAGHAEAICHEIIQRGVRVSWNCSVNPEYFSEHLAQLMRNAGCRRIDFGIDTASPRMIEKYQKSFHRDSLIKASQWCKETGIELSCSLIIGGPGEDNETIRDTFETMETVNPYVCSVMLGMRIYPGTKLAQIARDEAFIKDDQNLLHPRFYFSRDIGETGIEIMQHYQKKYPNWYFLGTRGVSVKERIKESYQREAV